MNLDNYILVQSIFSIIIELYLVSDMYSHTSLFSTSSTCIYSTIVGPTIKPIIQLQLDNIRSCRLYYGVENSKMFFIGLLSLS